MKGPGPARAPLPRRALERGFTLLELAVVVILISVFAAMALPQVTLQLRDRRVQEAAQRVALLYQQARLRAMGQGGAVLVRYTQGTNQQGAFELREAMVGTGAAYSCPLVPSTSCMNTDWSDSAVNQSRSISLMDLGRTAGLDSVFANLIPDAGAVTTDMDVCFTPLGRTMVRYGVTQPFTPLAGVPQLLVFRGANKTTPRGLQRRVLVLPTGIARLQL